MDTLVLNMEGKITAENTPAFEEDFLKQADSAKPENVVIDMERLEYISSAGLRLILKLRKMFPTLSLVNVSDQIYGILSTTGFTHLVDIKKAYRQISLEGLPVLGEGVTATVYRLDQERVVKIFKEEISGYFAGYTAVMLGYTNLGFLGGMAVPGVMRFGYGYVQGINEAAKEKVQKDK